MSRIEQALLRRLETESSVSAHEPRSSRPDPRLRLVSTGQGREAVRSVAENPYVRKSVSPTPRLRAPEVVLARTRSAAVLGSGSGRTSPLDSRPVVEAAAWERVLEQASVLARMPAPVAATGVVAGSSRADMGTSPVAPAPPIVETRVETPAAVTEQEFTWVPVQSYTQAGGAVLTHTIAAEQFRKLAGQVVRAQETHGVKVVMLTSALQSEGKSVISSALAHTLANSYKRDVLLLDADLRLPTLQTLFQLAAGRGLSELLDQPRDAQVSPHQVSPMLAVLPAGRPNRDPVGALASARMRRFIEAAAARYDFVVIDTPPVAVLPDANLLGSMVDAVLLVIKAGETQYGFVSQAVEALKKERILGIVLNYAEHGVALQAYEYSKY